MNLSIIIQTEPCTNQDFATGYEIAMAALRKGHSVQVFLYDEAVIAANKHMKMSGKRQVNIMMADLARMKVPIYACGACCLFRGITQEMLTEGSEMGGLPDLAKMIAWSDRVLNFSH